jgi:hypothetical protein
MAGTRSPHAGLAAICTAERNWRGKFHPDVRHRRTFLERRGAVARMHSLGPVVRRNRKALWTIPKRKDFVPHRPYGPRRGRPCEPCRCLPISTCPLWDSLLTEKGSLLRVPALGGQVAPPLAGLAICTPMRRLGAHRPLLENARQNIDRTEYNPCQGKYVVTPTQTPLPRLRGLRGNLPAFHGIDNFAIGLHRQRCLKFCFQRRRLGG